MFLIALSIATLAIYFNCGSSGSCAKTSLNTRDFVTPKADVKSSKEGGASLDNAS